MFTSVIGALTSALPKYFIFGAYVPLLIFSFVNFGLAYVLSAAVRSAVQSAYAASAPLTIGIAFVGTVAAAYIVSSINNFLRRFLEGRFVGPDAVRSFLSDRQQRRRAERQKTNRKAIAQRLAYRSRRPGWTERLRVAANTGHAASPERSSYNPVADPAALALDGLRHALNRPLDIDATTVEAVVTELEATLSVNDKLADAALYRDHEQLLLMIDTILNAAIISENENTLYLNTYFGGAMPAPTRMGNVADAMQGYAISRYGMDLTLFLSRLQAILVKNEAKDYPIVLDAKTQLDFLIACAWFSAVTTLTWFVALVALRGSPTAYAAIALAGPLVSWWFYLLATENYVAYALAVRACVDVNRFALLRALELPLPSTVHAELRLWSALSHAAATGTAIELSYEHTPK